jgi:outer membrane protein insertion porin family
MKRLGCLVVLFCLMVPLSAWGQFQIQDIRVEGLQRISAGTLFNYLPVEVSSTLDEARYPEVLRALFKTGFFTDVRLEREGDVLVVRVTERPSIASIDFEGNKDISNDDLTEALKQIGLAEGQVFDRSLLDRTELELRQLYFARGRYAVRIESEVKELPRNTVSIDISISEGTVARIKSIRIIGASTFEEEDLLEQLELEPPNWLSWISKRDRYSKSQLTADLETLRSYYLDRGYLKFSVDSTQVSITPDRKDIYITINVSEGAQYKVSGVEIAGDLPLPEESLWPLVSIAAGDVFSRAEATDTARRLSDRLGDEGYAFANVNTVPEFDEENRQVGLTLFIDPGRRVYVRRIDYSGNSRTYDEVLRREMRQMEGAWFSTTDVDRSRTRLERLGYFDEVNVETPEVAGSTDQVDVRYSVKERASGSLVLGAGFSQGSGVVLNASVSQDNFLGTGKRVSFTFNNSAVNRIYAFGYTNPYYTIDGVSRGFNVYYRTTDASEANLSDYTLDRFGGDVNYGIPLSEFDFLRFGLGATRTTVNFTDSTPQRIRDILEAKETDVFDVLEGTLSWSHDTRNRAIFPDRGTQTRASAEVSVPGSDWEYYKLTYGQESYLPLSQRYTLFLRGEVGLGDGYGNDDSLPFYENFFAGGVRSVRGFKSNSLGPRDPITGDPIGGELRLIGSAEFLFPPPFVGGDLSTLRMSGFLDFGQVYESTETFEFNELRYSVGVGVQWLSPLGPLTLSFAKPINADELDEEESIQFTFGAAF